MKALCQRADVSPNKVFPHNLRHLFARTFYSLEKDIVRLADLLGHSSVNTTRIYTIETGNEHRLRLERVEKLLLSTWRHKDDYVAMSGMYYIIFQLKLQYIYR